jgi:uncharacterized protein
MQDTQQWNTGRRLGRTIGGIVLSIVLLLALIVGAVGWIASDRALGPEIGETPWSLDDYPALSPEEITFESQTGVTLSGRFFPGEHDGGVILLHGFSQLQDQVLPLAQILNEAGFNVLSYDSRHPDRYGGDVYSTLGALEQHDLISAVDFMADHPDVNPERIGVYGASLGGATAILAGAQDSRLQAIAAEGAFSDGDNVIDSSFERYIGLPSFPFGPVAKQIAEWRADASLDDARPVDAISQIEDRPVLLIHGLDDDAVPPDHTERNLASGGTNVDAWLIPGAHHFDAHEVVADEYAERIRQFFITALVD